jgi:hypothetical protein
MDSVLGADNFKRFLKLTMGGNQFPLISFGVLPP